MGGRHEHGGKSSEGRFDKNEILEALAIASGWNIYDAGCGNGYMSKEFARVVGINGVVYAIDAYEQSIERLKTEVTGSNSNIIVEQRDICQRTMIADQMVDLVYLSLVYHGFTDEQKAGFLADAQRVLKPGGILAVLEWKKEKSTFGPPLEIRYSPEELAGDIKMKPENIIEIGKLIYLMRFVKYS